MSAYRCEWPAWTDWYEASGTPTRVQNSGALGGGRCDAGATDATYIGWQAAVAAGTYTLTVLYAASTAGGKFQMSVDGVDKGALTDAYNAGGTAYNNVLSITSIALTEGVHTIRMTANGKAAGSSAYNIYPQWLSLERTGA